MTARPTPRADSSDSGEVDDSPGLSRQVVHVLAWIGMAVGFGIAVHGFFLDYFVAAPLSQPIRAFGMERVLERLIDVVFGFGLANLCAMALVGCRRRLS